MKRTEKVEEVLKKATVVAETSTAESTRL